jgi:hypothetical protein
MQSQTVDGDVIRGIDTLGNARFVWTVIKGARLHRSQRLAAEFGLAELDLSDETVRRRRSTHTGRGRRLPGTRPWASRVAGDIECAGPLYRPIAGPSADACASCIARRSSI